MSISASAVLFRRRQAEGPGHGYEIDDGRRKLAEIGKRFAGFAVERGLQFVQPSVIVHLAAPVEIKIGFVPAPSGSIDGRSASKAANGSPCCRYPISSHLER